MFFDRIEGGNRAVLVHIDFPEGDDREDPAEFEELVTSAGGEALTTVLGSRSKPDPKTFIGGGKIEELKSAILLYEADVVLFNHSLSPSQERNIEKLVECRVVDRTGLILDIFAQRARTHEGKLQVELAQLQYQSARLVKGWSHLDRQKGGIGLRGTGETQLEIDRRLLGKRIAQVKARLEKVEKQRNQNRRSRERSDVHSVALVGYTNAGKSTLFNALTDADVYAADQLFATLDPTLRQLKVPDLGQVVLADTVGFIRHLPHKLVEAFKATLQETSEADLLLHVVDCADEERIDNIYQVEAVLEEINATEIPTIQVWNKVDLLPEFAPAIEYGEDGRPWRVWVSAKEQLGLDLVSKAVAQWLGDEIFSDDIVIKPKNAQLRALLFAHDAVLNESFDDQGNFCLEVRLQKKDFLQMLAKCEISADVYLEPEPKPFYEL